MECDPEKPTYVRCDGMHAVFALPCSRVTSHIAYPTDLEICVDWRRAVKLAHQIAEKVVPHLPSMRLFYWTKVYAQFKWKSRKQSHFAQYTYWPAPPPAPAERRCVHLFTSAFKWTKPTFAYPDPYNIYPKFQGLKLREDGTPDVEAHTTLWHWSFPMDPRLYTPEEWQTIKTWEGLVFYYNHQLKVCTAKHDYLGVYVTETRTGRSGIVEDIRPPRRYTQVWETVDGVDIRGINKKQWMKSLPLRYFVRMADGRRFETTRRSLAYYTPPFVEITYD